MAASLWTAPGFNREICSGSLEGAFREGDDGTRSKCGSRETVRRTAPSTQRQRRGKMEGGAGRARRRGELEDQRAGLLAAASPPPSL